MAKVQGHGVTPVSAGPFGARDRAQGPWRAPLATTVGLSPQIGRKPKGTRRRDPGYTAARMAGNVAGHEVAGVLVELHRSERTGVLEVTAEGVTTLLYVQDGHVVFAEAGVLSETLGRILVADGSLTTEQYAAVIDRMTSSLVDAEQVRFGEAAIELGFLTPQQVHDALSNQLGRKVLRCLQWPSATWRFREGADLLSEIVPFPCETFSVIADGVRRFFDFGRTSRMLDPVDALYVRLAPGALARAPQWHLHPTEARWMRQLDGTLTVAEALTRAGLDSLHVRQVLVLLLVADLVELTESAPPTTPVVVADPSSSRRDRPAFAPSPTRKPAETATALGSDDDRTTAVADEVPKTAIASASAASEPAVDPILERETAQRRAAVLLANIRAMRGAGRSSLPPPPGQKARLTAEQAHSRGRRHLDSGNMEAAATEFAYAVAERPDMLEYALCLAWARFRASGGGQVGEATAEVEKLTNRLLAQDQDNAFAYYVRGHLLLLRDDPQKAERAFRAAVRADASLVDAARHLHLLVRRRGG